MAPPRLGAYASETFHQIDAIDDYRTAAFVVALSKIANTYLDLGR